MPLPYNGILLIQDNLPRIFSMSALRLASFHILYFKLFKNGIGNGPALRFNKFGWHGEKRGQRYFFTKLLQQNDFHTFSQNPAIICNDIVAYQISIRYHQDLLSIGIYMYLCHKFLGKEGFLEERAVRTVVLFGLFQGSCGGQKGPICTRSCKSTESAESAQFC